MAFPPKMPPMQDAGPGAKMPFPPKRGMVKKGKRDSGRSGKRGSCK